MIELINKIFGLFEKLFGKIVNDIGDKIYSCYQRKLDPNNKPYNQLINLPYVRYGEGMCYYGKCFNLENKDELLKKSEYQKFYKTLGFFKKRSLIKKLINDFQINCYNDCDRFLISLIILFNSLSKKYVKKIFDKEKNNNQALALNIFYQEIDKIKPKLIDKNIKEYCLTFMKRNNK